MIAIKNKAEINSLRNGGKILASIMNKLIEKVRPGVSLGDLDELAENLILSIGGKPAFKNYGEDEKNLFPATICASLNNEVVHGIPYKHIIMSDGDLLKIDIGMKYDGMFTDMARTVPVGKISQNAQKILEVTEKSFWMGIGGLREGEMISTYSKSVEKYVQENGFSVVRNLVSHGIGKELHEDPQITNYFYKNFPDFILKAGMVFALEPMVNEGDCETVLGADGWVFETSDGKLSAHYENTVLITKKGVEVLTK